MIEGKRILVAPLNWGLGHASRCILIIRKLIQEQKEVILAADGAPLKMLRQEFPELQSIPFEGPEIRYPKRIPIPLYFGLKMPQLLWELKKEQAATQKMVEEYEIDGIISDNRYGVHHEKVHSILITHQLFVKSPIFERHVQQFIHSKIQQFNECWIPDFEGEENLSGELSHGQSDLKQLKFIGPLSRFQEVEDTAEKPKRKIMAILSGPEPNRSNLEAKIIQQLQQLQLPALLVQGVVKEQQEEVTRNGIRMVSHLNTEEMQREIQQSEVIICRSGYSSIMDLTALKKKALLIPTQGQSEQEYLAKHLATKEEFHAVSEAKLELKEALKYFGIA